MQDAFDGVTGTLGGLARDLAALYGIHQFAELIGGAIEAQAQLVHLSKATQLTVEQIGALSFSTKQAGGDAEAAAVAIGKLNVNIAKAQQGDVKAGAAFEAMGISVKGLGTASKDADTVLVEMANKFASYADGPEKAALAQREFGRGYQAVMAMLDQGGGTLQMQSDFWKKYSGVTTESAEAAHAFEQRLGELHVLTQSFSTTLANEMLPTLSGLVTALIGVREGSTNSQEAARGLATVFDVVVKAASYALERLMELGRELASFAANANALDEFIGKTQRIITTPTVHPFQALSDASDAYAAKRKAIQEGVDADLATQQETFAKFRKGMDEGFKGSGVDFGAGVTGRGQWGDLTTAPGIPKAASGKDEQKDALKEALLLQDEYVKRDVALEAQRTTLLAGYYAQNLVSISDYFSQRKSIQDLGLASQLADLDRSIALIEKHKATSDAKFTGGDQAKIDVLREKQNAAQVKAAESSAVDSQKAAEAYDKYAKDILATDAQVLTLQGHLSQAAGITFDSANSVMRAVFSREGNETANANLDAIRAYGQTLAKTSEITTLSAQASERLAIAEGRITLAVTTGERTSLDAMVATGRARADALVDLGKFADAQKAIADADAQHSPQLIINAQKAALAFEQLKATVDPLAASLNASFATGFDSAFSGFIAGTQTAGQAFGNFARSVMNDIEKILSKQLTEKLFGGSGGLGGLFSMLLGASSGGGSGVVAGGGGISFHAGGGFVQPFGISQVNENGVEGLTVGGKDYIMAGSAGARVVSAGKARSSGDSFTWNIASGVSRNELLALVPALEQSITANLVRQMRRPGFQGA